MKNSWKSVLLIIAGVICLILLSVMVLQYPGNHAIDLEEAIKTAEHNIEIQEKMRLDKVGNLADCVMQYDKHEAEVLKELADSRSGSGDVEDVTMYTQAVAEAYPELQSSKQYQTLMLELITIENEISQYRQAYNTAVERYNSYVKKFPQKLLLRWSGYESSSYERLEFDAPEDAPANLFGE